MPKPAKMNKSAKSLITIVAIVLVTVHFLFIAVYCFPQNDGLGNVYQLSRFYAYPVFQQNWALFTPAPSVERKLMVRYETKDGFSPWNDLLGSYILEHRQSRLSGKEAQVLMFSSSLIYQLNAWDAIPSKVFVSKPKNAEFKVLKYEVDQYLKTQHQIKENTGYELLLVSDGKTSKAFYIKSLKIK